MDRRNLWADNLCNLWTDVTYGQTTYVIWLGAIV